MSEEIKKVLNLLSEGKISTEEAEKLIEMMQRKPKSEGTYEKNKKYAKVYIEKDGHEIVNLTVPMSFLEMLLRLSTTGKNSLNIEGEEINFDIEKVKELIKDPEFYGKLVDIDSKEENVKVKIEIV